MDGSFAFFLLICVLFGIAGGLQGRAKGSSFVLWFFIAACLPLFGFIASVVYPGHQHELRRRCDGCGRMLPITDTMCMGCGTDLAFPEVRYHSEAAGPPLGAASAGVAPASTDPGTTPAPATAVPEPAAAGPGEGPGDEDGDGPNPYEQAAHAKEPAAAPAPAAGPSDAAA